MRNLFMSILIFVSLAALAQDNKLVLVDEYNGNYKELELGKLISFQLKDNPNIITGKITELHKNSFSFEEVTGKVSELPLDNVNAIVIQTTTGGGSVVVSVLKYLGGAFLGFYSLASVLGGAGFLISGEPEVGIILVVIGGGLGVLSYSLFNSAGKSGPAGIRNKYILMQESKYKLLIETR